MKAVWVFLGCLNAACVVTFMLTGNRLMTFLCLLGLLACGWLYDQEGAS